MFFSLQRKSDWAECLEQDGTFHFLKVEDLELVPHRDSERLDFMLKNQFVATLSEDTDDDFFIVQAQLSRQATTFGRGWTPCEAIDHAIKQEQPNETT